MSKKLTKEEFISKAFKIHGNLFDYSLVEYKDYHIKVQIICKKHGSFWQNPVNHLSGKGCPNCKRLDIERFIIKSRKVHGNRYDYSKVDYKTSKIKVCIICPDHGEFWQRPHDHFNGQGCAECKNNLQKFNKEIFIDKAKVVHNNKYDYSLIEYNGSNSKVQIICPSHGIFYQQSNSHLRGSGCPKCKSSKGEKQIEQWLKEHNIKYETQKRFKDCKNKKPLPFDFYLNEFNICIEFDGKQHFNPVNYFGGEKNSIINFNKTKINDSIKNKFCKKNKISIYRINFKQNIQTELSKLLKV